MPITFYENGFQQANKTKKPAIKLKKGGYWNFLNSNNPMKDISV